MLRTIQLTKRYEDGELALDSLNLDIQPGKIYFLLGANGAGKTTTINLFLNFITPTSGSVIINGIDATKNPLEAKKHVAFLSENVMLYGNFTARQNLDFAQPLGVFLRQNHEYLPDSFADTLYFVSDNIYNYTVHAISTIFGQRLRTDRRTDIALSYLFRVFRLSGRIYLQPHKKLSGKHYCKSVYLVFSAISVT
jgi:ABC-type Na+ transport system ATPase subunit NatA